MGWGFPWCGGASTRCGLNKLWLNKFVILIYHECAQIPYPDIYGLVLAHDTKISVPFMGAQKCRSRP